MSELNELMRPVQTGDPTAGEELCLRLRPLLEPMIRRQLREMGAGRQLGTSDVFQTVMRRWLEYEQEDGPPKNVSAFLRQVARNRIREVVRSADYRLAATGEGVQELQGSDPSPLQQLVEREELDRVRTTLEDGVYESLRLVAGKEAAWEEAARRYAPGKSPEAWRKHCERRLAEARQRLGGDEHSPR